MSLAPSQRPTSDPPAATPRPAEQPSNGNGRSSGRGKRRSTSHLKIVPETLKQREHVKHAAEQFIERIDKSQPMTRSELEAHARTLLAEQSLPEKYLGFTMVMLGNFFWKRQLLAIPFERRMLLLPHCLKHAEGCPADYDEFGLDCERCGACSIADYKGKAEELGYKVLVAEGSPVVLKIIVSGYIDGILGVACLNVLEKAIDKVLLAGVPSYAVPLHSGDCLNTTLDESWVWDVLDKYEPLTNTATSSYVPLMRAANELFDDEFEQLLPRVRTRTSQQAESPLGRTEQIAYDWLATGGKRFRPFITLAAYHALTGGQDAGQDRGIDTQLDFPPAVRRVALCIEAFHKASLVHDDIEDDDPYRYGRETLHRHYDVATAINVGDYLIGLGYRLINSVRDDLGSDTACDILDRMAAAHVKLCDGQGAELAWQKETDSRLAPLDALQIYALKTAPAFEAALYAGLRMAGPAEQYSELCQLFARHLGVGFQILNDLKDWQGDDNNKLVAGGDMLGVRPTLLLALALDGADAQRRQQIERLLADEGPAAMRVASLARLFGEWEVFEKAEALVDKSRARAEALADEVQPEALRQLLYFLVDTVLSDGDLPARASNAVLVPLPVAPANSD